jgi:hypothetical protein
MEHTLKELRKMAKEHRSKISGAALGKASADELKAEIAFYERAHKADAARNQRLANLKSAGKKAEPAPPPVEVAEKKKLSKTVSVMKQVVTAAPVLKVRRSTKKQETASSEE